LTNEIHLISFIAIEKREKDEEHSENILTMEDLLVKESVDDLSYMGFEEIKKAGESEESYESRIRNLSRVASIEPFQMAMNRYFIHHYHAQLIDINETY